jgi:hypothetical protein
MRMPYASPRAPRYDDHEHIHQPPEGASDGKCGITSASTQRCLRVQMWGNISNYLKVPASAHVWSIQQMPPVVCFLVWRNSETASESRYITGKTDLRQRQVHGIGLMELRGGWCTFRTHSLRKFRRTSTRNKQAFDVSVCSPNCTPVYS